MQDHRRSVFESANRPTPLMVACAIAVITIIAMVAARCSGANKTSIVSATADPIPSVAVAPTPASATAPSLPSLDVVSRRLQALAPDRAADRLGWSTPVRDDSGVYRFVKLGPEAVLRADLADDGQIKALSLQGPRPSTVRTADQMGDLIVLLVMPQASAADLKRAAHTLGSLLPDPYSTDYKSTSLELGADRFEVNPGVFDVTIKASPAS